MSEPKRKRKRESSAEAVILDLFLRDTLASAHSLKTALSDLRQTRLDIFMKLIADHDQAISADEELLKKQLDQRCPCMSKSLAECDCRAEGAMQTDLTIAQSHLQAAYDAASEAKLGTTHHDLYMAVCDAFNACNEALQRLNDELDEA
jgi:hypothetical protein